MILYIVVETKGRSWWNGLHQQEGVFIKAKDVEGLMANV
jgi:hypothetical protein